MCVGMAWNDVTNWILLNYTAASLYSVIAGGDYGETNAGRAAWISLVNGSSLQSNCNKEGFNARCSHESSRLGILSNNENNCVSCNSFIGFGCKMGIISSGNVQTYPKKPTLRTFGYIFVQ